MDKVYKAFVAETKAVDLDLGIFEAMISTEAVDRQGDIVRATGAKLDNYLKNPVVLWAHDYGEMPVARTLSIEIMAGKGLKARFQFPEWGVSERADEVRRLWAAGFLNATSIGFQPITAQPLGDRNDFWGPQEFVEWELLEYSIVPVPANQEALRLAVKRMDAELNKPRTHAEGGVVHPRGPFIPEPGEAIFISNAVGTIVPPNYGGLLTKRGRVLSAANEKKLREAQTLLEEVLRQLQAEETPEPEQDGITGGQDQPDTHSGKTEPTTDDGTKQRSEVTAALSTFFDAMRGLK